MHIFNLKVPQFFVIFGDLSSQTGSSVLKTGFSLKFLSDIEGGV